MRVLLIHNSYQQPGGEDEVVRTEGALLASAGIQVETYFRHNDELKQRKNLVALPFHTIWSRHSHRELTELLRRVRPDIAHFHNTLPLISPAAYYACKEAGVPVVQTLHNYRVVCPGANLTRNGEPCEECVGKTFPYPAVRHACYRHSRPATATVAAMLTIHNAMGTYTAAVDRYIALSDFSRRKFIAGGLPENRIIVKPNCVFPDPVFCDDAPSLRNYVLYLGRFSQEKGIETFARALRLLSKQIRVRIIGDGPLRERITEEVASLKNVTVEGWVPRSEVMTLLRGARLVVCPSECFENFPLTVVEAFARGTPVLCSRIGVHEEIVQDRVTGLHFAVNDPADLADKIELFWDSDDLLTKVAFAARSGFEGSLTADRNRQKLLSIYRGVMQHEPAAEEISVG